MADLLAAIAGLPPWHLALGATWLLLQGCIVPSVPEEILVVTLGMLVGQGRIGPAFALVAVLAGLLPANSATVFFGGLGRRFRPGGFLGRALASPRIEAASAMLRRFGPVAVVATRFLPFVRGPIYLAIGLSGFRVRRFLAIDAAAALVQVPLLLWLGSRLGSGVTLAEAWSRVGWLTATVAGVAAAIVGLRRVADRWPAARADELHPSSRKRRRSATRARHHAAPTIAREVRGW